MPRHRDPHRGLLAPADVTRARKDPIGDSQRAVGLLTPEAGAPSALEAEFPRLMDIFAQGAARRQAERDARPRGPGLLRGGRIPEGQERSRTAAAIRDVLRRQLVPTTLEELRDLPRALVTGDPEAQGTLLPEILVGFTGVGDVGLATRDIAREGITPSTGFGAALAALPLFGGALRATKRVAGVVEEVASAARRIQAPTFEPLARAGRTAARSADEAQDLNRVAREVIEQGKPLSASVAFRDPATGRVFPGRAGEIHADVALPEGVRRGDLDDGFMLNGVFARRIDADAISDRVTEAQELLRGTPAGELRDLIARSEAASGTRRVVARGEEATEAIPDLTEEARRLIAAVRNEDRPDVIARQLRDIIEAQRSAQQLR